MIAIIGVVLGILVPILQIFIEENSAKAKARKELQNSGIKLIQEGTASNDISLINAGICRINRSRVLNTRR